MPASRRSTTPNVGLPGFPPPYWCAPNAALYLGDVRECLRELSARSVHCCVTSPPYWGLRDYGTGTWEGGSAECDHVGRASKASSRSTLPGVLTSMKPGNKVNSAQEVDDIQYRGICGKCGAKRTDMQIGAETSPDCGTGGQAQCGGCFVCSMVGVFREVYRVLRDDGTLWLNLGDSYSSGASGQNGTGPTTTMNSPDKGANQRDSRLPYKGLPSGNLVGIPWRVVLALQADGWVLRSDIIWYSPNKMPESVTNRCTKSHEHIFLLAKSQDYYYDSVAIEEESKSVWNSKKAFVDQKKKTADRLGLSAKQVDQMRTQFAFNAHHPDINQNTKNKRDVWIVSSRGYPGAHFATFSPELITPCILAGTSEHGCCAACARPWERVVAKERGSGRAGGAGGDGFGSRRPEALASGVNQIETWNQVVSAQTVGWRKACGCLTDEVVPAVVLDSFVGSGTSVATAIQLGRAGVGIDLSETYLRENAVPRIEAAISGEKVRRPTVACLPGSPPPPRKLRGT